MSPGLSWFPIAAGLQDGLNPCLLMTSSAVLLGLRWFKRAGINPWWILLLLGSLIIDGFIFNCGYLDRFTVNNKYFEIITRLFYVLLAVIFALKAIEFLKQWYSLVKGKTIPTEARLTKKFTGLSLIFFISLAGFLLALFASFWPINYYILVFSIYMTMPSQFFPMASLVLIYTVMSLWVVYMMIWVSSLEEKNPRLFKIIASAVLFSASFGVIDIIFMKG